MATINFTGAITASTSSVGYFELFSVLFPKGEFLPAYYNTFSRATTDGSRTFASYFNTASLLATPTTWNFSSNSEYAEMSGFAYTDSSGNTIGCHSLEDDIFNLAGGSDYANIRPTDFTIASAIYPSGSDAMLDGGFRLTANGGPGNDNILCNWAVKDYTVNRKDITATQTVIPAFIVNGDAGNDILRVANAAGIIHGDTPGASATGADIIQADVFSDRILGGASADTIQGSGDSFYFNDPFRYSQALIQKDLITGGTGKDTFTLDAPNSYGLNGANDFAVITDFESTDRIASALYRGDLLIDGTDGSLSLAATSAYIATTVTYTARIYLDSDASNTVNTGDELLLYICGVQPTAANFVYGI